MQFTSRCGSPENVTLRSVAKETGGGICSLFHALHSAEGSAEETEAMLPPVHEGPSHPLPLHGAHVGMLVLSWRANPAAYPKIL